MWKQITIGWIFGLIAIASSADDHGRGHEPRDHQGDNLQNSRPSTPTAMAVPHNTFQRESRPVISGSASAQNYPRPIINNPQPAAQTVLTNANRERFGLVESGALNQGRYYNRHNRNRGYHVEGRYHGSNYHGNQSVFIYPSATSVFSPNIYYPSRYYVCYQVDQVQSDRYHVSCPYPVAWYSTDPVYASYQYQSNYRPEYVCPRYRAAQFREFATQFDAITWSNQYCNIWQYNQAEPEPVYEDADADSDSE
jgi:hypothetical protein